MDFKQSELQERRNKTVVSLATVQSVVDREFKNDLIYYFCIALEVYIIANNLKCRGKKALP